MVTVNRSKAGIYFVGDDGYNFEDEDVGTITAPTGWTQVTSAGYVTSALYGHVNVLQGLSIVDNYEIYEEVGTQESGTIQGYIFLPNNPVANSWQKLDVYTTGGGTEVIEFYGYVASGATTGKFTYHAADLVTGLETDKWYHFSICWERTAGGYDPFGDGALAQNKCRFYINGTKYGDYNLSNNNDPARIVIYAINNNAQYYYDWSAIDAIGYSWDATYDLDDNLALEEDATISNSDISQMKIHYPTTLEPTNVRFDGETYEKYYPICVAKIKPTEDIFLGCQIKITDTHTSNSATASEVIFKGEVVKKLTSKASGFIPSYLIFSNAKEMDSIKPEGSYTKDTDGYISDILTNLCDKLTEGTLSDGADLGTFTAAGDKAFTLIIKQCARFDGYLAYIDSSAGADNADLMYNDGSTDTGVDIDESSSTLRGLRAFSQLDEHINKVIVRGGIQADGTRAEGTASDTTSQGLYGIIPTYDTDTNLNTDALCASKAAQILADNEFGNRRVVLGYKDATKGMLQPGETVTFDWDKDIHDIGFTIEQEQYIIARNTYDVKTGVNVLTLFSSIYYPPISDGELLQETSHVALQNSATFIEQHDREILLINAVPRSGFTSGANNVYWTSGFITFGTTSRTAGTPYEAFYHLPSDYVDGEDITVIILWKSTVATDVVDYNIRPYYSRDGVNAFNAAAAAQNSTWTGGGANTLNVETLTFDGSSLQAGDALALNVQMEDDDNTVVISSPGIILKVPVNTRV